MSSTPWFGSEVYVEVSIPDGPSLAVEIAEDDDVRSLVSKLKAAVSELLD
ncbi:hypothetical protein [Ruania rhizosphaerae]|nr:hypothetical protein [Ruania rhizosphaerae]